LSGTDRGRGAGEKKGMVGDAGKMI
jgi:hypothetical protein